jgi:hypothetical protein
VHEIAGYILECLVLVVIRGFLLHMHVWCERARPWGKPQYIMQLSQKKCQVNSPRKERFTRDSARTSVVYLAPEVIGQINPSRTAVIVQWWYSREVRK